MSLFRKGTSGNPLGRPKGRKSEVLKAFDAALACQKVGVNPFEILAEIAAKHTKQPKLRILACSHLIKYLAPQLRSIDISSNGQSIVNMLFNLGEGKLNAEPPVDQ